MKIDIRKLTTASLDFADSVRAAAGWNQTRADWRRLLAFEPEGCFLAEIGGEPAGTATTIRYGEELGWIGMVLVDPAFQRRGVATALMERALEFLSPRVACVKLDATPAGQPVYERLGFLPEFELCRWERPGGAPTRLERAVSRGIADFDATAFGAERGSWLAALARDAKVSRRGPDALGMIRSGEHHDYLGPLTASTPEAGRELAGELISQLDRQTFWDVPEPNRVAVELAEAHDFKRVRPLLRMWMGRQLLAGSPELQFAIGDPATG